MVIIMDEITVKEIRAGVKEALLEMDIVAAKTRLIIWEDMISESGFEEYSVRDITEYYKIKHIVDAMYKEL